MKKALFFLFILNTALCFSQQKVIDSLEKIASSGKQDTSTINAINELAKLTFFNSDYKNSQKYANLSKELSLKTNYKKGLDKAFSWLGNIHYRQSDYPNALNNYSLSLAVKKEIGNMVNVALTYNVIGGVYLDMGNYSEALNCQREALKINTKIKDKNGEANCYNNMGNIFYQQGNYPEAIKNNFASLKIREETKDKVGIATSYLNLGNVYQGQGDYKEALKNQLAALKIFNESDNKQYQSTAYLNVGLSYKQLGNYEEALKNYYSALKISEEIGDKASIAHTYNNIGSVYQDKNNLEEALNNHQKALSIQEAIGDKNGMCVSLTNIGSAYNSLGKNQLAREFVTKSLMLSNAMGNLERSTDAHSVLCSIYLKRLDFENAYKHYFQFIAGRDSMINEENIKKIVRMEMNFDFAKKEAVSNLEKRQLADQNQIQLLQISRRNYIMLALGLLLLIIVFISWLLLRQNQLKAQQTAIQLEQKLLRSQMNPHFIFNALATIESFIYENQPKEAGRYLSDFARLMRLILENSTTEYITLEKEIKTLEYYLSLQKLRLENDLTYTIEVSDTLNASDVMIPPMLTQPFIENAIEHGFRGSKQMGIVTISFKEKDGQLVVEVKDNGIGINKAKENEKQKQHKSMALQITKERLAVLNRSKKQKLTFSISDIADENKQSTGTRVIFSIPL